MDPCEAGPQTYLYGCELTSGKEVKFIPEEDDVEHQLSIRMVCVDPSTKDDLHIVEVEGLGAEGNQVKAVLAALKPSTMPSVCLDGFGITPPVIFRLKAGAGPVHISGQHLVMMPSFDEEDMDEDDEEEEASINPLKRLAPAGMGPSKKMKMMEEEDDDDDDDDDDEDDDEDDFDEDDDEEEEEESPVKPKKAPSKPQTPVAQNGKSHKPNTPAAKPQKTPDNKKKNDKKPQTPKTPQTPRPPPSVADVKAKMMASVQKGVTLPKLQPKFENYMKNTFKVTDSKTIEELWKWRQTVDESK